MAADPTRGTRAGWVGLVGTLGLLALACWVVATSHSFAAAGAAAHLAIGVFVWLGVVVHERRRARALADRLELERLSSLASEGRRSLFSSERAAESDAAQSLDRFRRVGAKVLAVAAGCSELSLAWLLVTRFPAEGGARPSLPGAAALCAAAFALLLLGRYAFALGRSGVPAASGGGRRATSAALALLLAGLAIAAQEAFPFATHADLLGYAFAAVEALLGLEAFALLLLDLYRPRRQGEQARPPYDSRLLGLLSAPGDLARTIGQAVDYQFGFALSQTWLYRFLQRWVAPLALFALLAFWVLSSLVVVGPREQGVLRRFGSTHGEPLEPGLHLKLPWPVDSVEHVQSRRLHALITGGHGADADEPDADADVPTQPAAILWTEGGHVEGGGEETLVLIARSLGKDEDAAKITPVNLLAASASVDYEITNLHAFVHQVEDPHAVLELLAERELSFLLSGEDLDTLLRERRVHASELKARLQRAADAVQLGVTVRDTALTDLHPPVEVGEAFEAVTVAVERARAFVIEAEVDAAAVLPRSRSQAQELRSQARREALERVELAEADAKHFEALRAIDQAAPGVWRMSRLLDRLTAATKDKRKILLGRPGGALIDLGLQEKVSVEETGFGQRDFVPQPDEEED